MAISFCDEFNIPLSEFRKTKALNIVLDMDSHFFIDPKLIELCKIPEFKSAKKQIRDFFDKASDSIGSIKLLEKIELYNKAICNANPRLYDVYVSLYLKNEK